MSGKGKEFRPICDTWLLAPSKIGYYGAYPNGFMQRARCLLCRMDEPLLHVCSGRVRDYPGYGVGSSDRTLDLNPAVSPDYLQDARDPWPTCSPGWPAILADPPYTEADADHYLQYWSTDAGQLSLALPSPSQLVHRAMEALRPGGKFGILHYLHPKIPTRARLVACVAVQQGANTRGRWFTVLEKELDHWDRTRGG